LPECIAQERITQLRLIKWTPKAPSCFYFPHKSQPPDPSERKNIVKQEHTKNIYIVYFFFTTVYNYVYFKRYANYDAGAMSGSHALKRKEGMTSAPLALLLFFRF
jgi:hypothetical protein